MEEENKIQTILRKSKKSVLYEHTSLIDEKILNSSLYKQLEVWRIIRNKIIHNEGLVKKNECYKLKGTVMLEYLDYVDKYDIILKNEDIIKFIEIISNFTSLICSSLNIKKEIKIFNKSQRLQF
ncbi:hypothetical protein [Clostridium perfringens]|uniref:hypothetical protein n=1 Tax=Clostridium perfringens TaxID=1502 RepID=UPI0024BC15DA|nr:hypothetical protein [Clostridium perfringens]